MFLVERPNIIFHRFIGDGIMNSRFLLELEPYLIVEEEVVQSFVLHAIQDYPFLPVEWQNRLLEKAFKDEKNRTSILHYACRKEANEEMNRVYAVVGRSIRNVAVEIT